MDKLHTAEALANSSILKETEALRLQSAAQQECTAQMVLAREHLDNYQREVMLHGADLGVLATIREQHYAINNQLQVLFT